LRHEEAVDFAFLEDVISVISWLNAQIQILAFLYPRLASSQIGFAQGNGEAKNESRKERDETGTEAVEGKGEEKKKIRGRKDFLLHPCSTGPGYVPANIKNNYLLDGMQQETLCFNVPLVT